MKIQHEHRHLGSEFDWLAVDTHGLCFFISTAGFGWIPDSVTAPSYPAQTLSLVMGLPVRTEAIVHRDQGTSREWSEAAKRGFYAIDWDYSTDNYTLAAEPEVPILSPQLPAEVLRIVGMARVALNRINRSVTIQHHQL
jgi:hypothetical protein